MKAAVRLLVRFLLWFGLLLLVVSTFIVAYEYASGYDPQVDAGDYPLLALYIDAILQLFLPTATFAALIALFDIVREAESVAAPLALLFVAWSALLAVGVVLLSQGRQEVVAPTPALPLERIVRGSELSLFAARRSGETYGPVIVHEPDRFRLVNEARLRPSERMLSIPEIDRVIALDELSNSYPAMVRVPAPLRGIAADIEFVNQFVRGRAISEAPNAGNAVPARTDSEGGEQTSAIWFNVAGLSLFLLGLWTFVRLTRWPLFNVILALAAWRFAFWVIPAVMIGSVRPFVVAAFSSAVLPTVSAGVLGGIGVLLLAAGVLLPPATKKGASM